MKHRTLIIALTAAALLPSSTLAHVALTQPQGEAGRYHGAFFRVGHGCGEAATTALTIRLPDAVPPFGPSPGRAGPSPSNESRWTRPSSCTDGR